MAFLAIALLRFFGKTSFIVADNAFALVAQTNNNKGWLMKKRIIKHVYSVICILVVKADFQGGQV
ncbi:hypothetical protein EMIT0194P_20510 [Pseudomonas serbica]